jgi:pilus assembly protein Flp/PilA
MLEMIRHFSSPKRRNEEGASAVEYGLLVALIAAVIVLAVWALGSLVNDAFQDTCGDIAKGGAAASQGASNCTSD